MLKAQTVRNASRGLLSGSGAAGMPASFGLEALKAQAWQPALILFGRCCRTRRTRLLATLIGERSSAVTLPTEAWNSRELLRNGEWQLPGQYKKDNRSGGGDRRPCCDYTIAISLTPYHSCCGGMTEDATDVWKANSASCGSKLRMPREGSELWEMKTWERAKLLAALG